MENDCHAVVQNAITTLEALRVYSLFNASLFIGFYRAIDFPKYQYVTAIHNFCMRKKSNVGHGRGKERGCAQSLNSVHWEGKMPLASWNNSANDSIMKFHRIL